MRILAIVGTFLFVTHLSVTGRFVSYKKPDPPSSNVPHGLKNQARRGIASQSSTEGVYVAELANDDTKTGYLTQQSCSRTRNENDPWWMVTFNHYIQVTDVIIHPYLLDDTPKEWAIVIGPNRRGQYDICGVASKTSPSSGTRAFVCPPDTMGQTLKIISYGSRVTLTLCEVLAYGTIVKRRKNIALDGVASQSSTHSSNLARKAVDGNADGVYDHFSCSMTKTEESNPWWLITFKSFSRVYEVFIASRSDRCGEKRQILDVIVGPNRGVFAECTSGDDDVPPDEMQPFKCPDDTAGLTLKIIKPGRNTSLTICEVFIYGRGYKKYESITANGRVSQSSVYHISSSLPLNAEKATDGNVDGILGHLSCAMTMKENYPWWKVVFNDVTRVNGVYIAGRTDCCRDRRYGVYVQRAQDKQDKRCKGTNLGAAVLNCRRTPGTSLIIKGLAMNQQLTLCEVVVWGKVLGLCKGVKCQHGGICVPTNGLAVCSCSKHYSGKLCEVCVGELKKYALNRRHEGGEERTAVRTLKKCKQTCLQVVANCVAIDFQNGVCRIHYKDNYEPEQLVKAYGNKHYRMLPADGTRCPK